MTDAHRDPKPENMTFPRCGECGSRVVLMARPGRTREMRVGHHVPVPDDFAIPTCVTCFEEFSVPEIMDVLDEMLRGK